MENKSISEGRQWEDNGLIFTENIRQEYPANECIISSGHIVGDNKPKTDTMYLQLEKKGKITTQLLLRPDEMAAIAWVATGSLWSHEIMLHDQEIISS